MTYETALASEPTKRELPMIPWTSREKISLISEIRMHALPPIPHVSRHDLSPVPSSTRLKGQSAPRSKRGGEWQGVSARG